MINRVVLVLLFFVLKLGLSYGQCPAGGAVFVNEIYNESGSTKEYIELVVVGDPANPTDPVNLSGWIVDDNNAAQAGQGTATGHLKLDNTFSSVNPGAIILIYNEVDPYPGLPANNPPWLYVVAGSDIDGCSTSPNTSNSGYTPCGTAGGSYPYVGMRNGGDILQTRDASENFYHALRYGNVNVEADVNPVDVSDKSIGLDCGDWFDGNNYTITTQTPGEANSAANQLLINSIKDGTIDCNNISLSCTPPCPGIDQMEIISSPVCDYDNYTLRASGLSKMGQTANGDKDFGIDFVYFNGSTPPADAYIGGTSLANVAYSDLTGIDPNQIAEVDVSSGTLAPGTYTICAILLETSANDCKPQQCDVLIINQSPEASLDGETIFCPEDCNQINTIITGGTEPYDASFTLSIGSFNIPFNIPAYDTNDEIIICYSGTIAPYWDAAANTFYVPTSMLGIPFTGSGSITLNSLVDDNGCAAQDINPNFMTLIFKDDLDIHSAGPLEECDYDFDGKATFDLTVLDDVLKDYESGLTANWYQDSDCTNIIPDPTSFTTATTTVYVFLSDDSGEKCESDTIPIDLIVIDIPNPGQDAEINICNSEPCVDFDFEMGPDYESGYIWQDLDNAGVDLDYTNCVVFANVSPGTYHFSYTTQDVDGKCDPVSATLTVNISEKGNPGEDNTDTYCGAPTNTIDLYGYLSDPHDGGGTWYDEFGNVINNPDDLDLSGEPIGVYKYYYTIENTPCDPEQAEIIIEIISQPNAGNNNEIFVCNSGQNTLVNLDAALGVHDSNGDWFDIDTSNVDLSSPNYVDFTGVDTDTFKFKYLIPDNGACLEDSAIITIYVLAAPNAGKDGTKSICIGSLDTLNLYNYLGQKYDTTGIWTQIGGDSVNISRPDTMVFSAEPIGVDSFLYETAGMCGNDTAYVYISIVSSPYAGDDYEYSICQGTTINLFDSLKNYNIGGIWLDLNGDTISNFNNYTLDQLTAYNFLYVLPANGTCIGDTAIAKIKTLAAPEAGIATDFAVCEGSIETFNLFDHINGYSTDLGLWLTSTNTVVSNSKAISFKDYSLGKHVFKYLVPPKGNCPEDVAFLTVSIVSAPVAGEDNEITICNGDLNNTVNLEDLLGNHDLGGDWSNLDNANVDLNILSGVSFNSIPIGTYRFKYLIESNSSCPDDSAIVSVTVKAKIFAGNDKELTFCEGGTELVDVIKELNPEDNTEYVIEDIAQTGALIGDTGKIDLSKLTKGTYQFTLTTGGQDLCGEDIAYLTINIVEKLNAGTDNDTEICNDNSIIDLNDFLGTHDGGGSWTDLDNAGVNPQLTDGKDISFKDVGSGTYRFEYKIDGSASCPEAKALISVMVKEVTYSTYSDVLCPGQTVKVGSGIYSVENPNGTEILTNSNGCDSIITVKINEKSISSSFSAEMENCFGVGKFVLEGMEGATLPIKLSISDIGEFTITEFPYEIKNLNAGNYLFSLIDADGCESNINDTFTIENFVDYQINTKITSIENAYSIKVETDMTPKTIVWSPTDYLSCSDCLNPTATPETDQKYIVTITNEEGCEVSDTISLNAIEKEIFIDIPNVFTPDGDGKNDYFYAKSNNFDLSYTMRIFNRWGEKVFYGENLNFNNSTDGWDGTFKGKRANPGVYVYMIKINYNSDKREIRSGDILLLR